MSGASESTRGIRTLPDEAGDITSAEATWVATEAAVGNFIYSEVPSGTVNGSNTTFTLADTPSSGTLQLYVNGFRFKVGAGEDYTLSGATITMLTAPPTNSIILADYRA